MTFSLKSFFAAALLLTAVSPATASYGITDTTTYHVRAGWDRLIGDAPDSPIVKEGAENQYYVGAGISYRFGF